jgi:hypothetical protein
MRRFAFRQWRRDRDRLIPRRGGGGLVDGQFPGRYGYLQLAIAGSIRIASCHASGGLGGAAARGSPIGRGRGLLRGGVTSAALVGGDALTYFLLPGGGRFGLDYSCAQDSSVPSNAPSGPVVVTRGCCCGLQTPCIWSRQTLRSRKRGGCAKRTGTPLSPVLSAGRERDKEDAIFACCQSCAADLPV